MNKRTYRERIWLRILAGTVIAVAVVVVLLSIFDAPLRQTVFGDISAIAREPLVQLATVTFVAGLGIFEYLDNIKRLFELGVGLFGYDAAVFTKGARAFEGIPEEYVRRPELEQEARDAMLPAERPRLVVLYGPRDSGKTTLWRFLVLRGLNRRYRGRVIDSRGDRQSIEVGPGETEDEVRTRIARRVLDRVIVRCGLPGDVGEAISTMSAAIATHFRREEKPWLIIIDQIDDGTFPFERVLPPLYGTRNTVVVVCRHQAVAEDAQVGYRGGASPTRHEVAMRPFTQQQAIQLLGYLLQRRHQRFPQGIRRSFAPHLANTTPGIIQRISDAFSSDPGSEMVREVNETLDMTAGAGGETRLGEIVRLSMQQLREPERLFIIALGLFDGETVGGQVLRAVADRLRQVDDPTPEELVENAIARRYLRPVEPKKKSPITQQRYFITKLGRGVSRTLILREGAQSELRAGAALLDYYRSAAGRRQLEYVETLPNVLGIMEWAQVPPRTLPQGDVVSFSRLFRDVVYYAGSWGPGSLWLRYAMNIALQTDRQSVLGELAGAHARILLGRGRPLPAQKEIELARAAFAQASEGAAKNLELGVGDPAVLKSNMLYCRLQTLWLDHLGASSQLARVSGFTSDETLRKIIADVTSARDRLREETVSGHARRTWLKRRVELALTLDEAETRIRLGELLYRGGHRAEARQQWVRVGDLARDVRARAADTLREHGTRARASRASASSAKAVGNRAALDAMMVSWRTEGMLCRYQSEHAPIWRRPLLRRRGVFCLERSLRYAAQLNSRYEQALALYEVAQLAMTGVPAVRHTPRPPRSPWVMRMARAGLCWGSPRWWRLRTAKAQVRLASAYSSALGAQVIHVRCLVALADIALRQWRMNPRDDLFQAAREYAQNAQAIVGRLRVATPELAERLYLLPAWILTPAPAAHDETSPPSMPISA